MGVKIHCKKEFLKIPPIKTRDLLMNPEKIRAAFRTALERDVHVEGWD